MCTYRRPVIAAALLALLAILDCLVSASPAQARGPTLTVELHSASGAAVGRVVFTAQSSNAQGSKVALAFRGCSYVPNGCGEVVLRPGSCAHLALGRSFNISAGWPIGYPFTK